MSWYDNLWSFQNRRGAASLDEVSPQQLLEDYELDFIKDAETGQQFAVATPRKQNASGSKDSHLGTEFGTTSASPWTSFTRNEYNPQLLGFKGLQIYDKMRKSDGVVRGTLRAVKTPVLSGRWFVQPCTVDGDEPLDVLQKEAYEEAAEWVWCNLTEHMSISWTQVLVESLLCLDFGYYMFEKVWENQIIEGELRTVLTKLAPRHPMDVKEWVFDANGGPVGVWFYVTNANIIGDSVFIPIDKLLVFSFDREAGNIEGISILRSAYKHWYFKQQLEKIDAIQKERHGIGIPIIMLPMGYTPEDKATAQELGRNIRTNERAHVVLPPNWELKMLKLEGQPVDALNSVEYHDECIRENILVNFIGQNAREDDLVMFFKSVRVVADIVASTFCQYLIPQMIQKNFPGMERYPKLKVRRVGETADWRTLSFGIRNLVGAGVIIPDKQLEALLREEMDLTEIDESSARLIATPQNPYDVNEAVGTQGMLPADSTNGTQDDPSMDTTPPSDVHNNKSPQYNKSPRRPRSPRGRKARGAVAGLPRQAVPSAKMPRANGGGDRSGG
jgi:hypothetical protein